MPTINSLFRSLARSQEEQDEARKREEEAAVAERRRQLEDMKKATEEKWRLAEEEKERERAAEEERLEKEKKETQQSLMRESEMVAVAAVEKSDSWESRYMCHVQTEGEVATSQHVLHSEGVAGLGSEGGVGLARFVERGGAGGGVEVEVLEAGEVIARGTFRGDVLATKGFMQWESGADEAGRVEACKKMAKKLERKMKAVYLK